MFFEVPEPKKIEELSAIVIDQQALIRDAIKSVLLQAGVRNVFPCSNAFEALSACGSESFDLVFISFNLNRDKDGFHLLEELKFKGYIKNQTRVVFLSADTDKGLVNSVVEMQPDDFWIKPFDIKGINKRLSFILNVKEVLHKPLCFADLNDYSRAIYYSDRLIANKKLSEFHPRLYRLKGRCLFALSEYPDAEEFFAELLKKYKFNWVYIGLTHSLLRQKKFDEAQKLIDELKMRDDTRCAVHDLMAQHYVENADYEQAYTEIIEAAKMAPRNIERNKRSWDLARLNHDRAGQLQATLMMAKYAKNSIHDSPVFTLYVIRSHIDLANSLDDESSTQLGLAEKKLNELMSNPKYYRELKPQFDVVLARLSCARGDKRKAEKILRELDRNESNNLEFNFDLIKALHEVGDREKCIHLLNESKALADNDSFSGNILNKFIEQELDEKSEIHFTPKELTKMAAAYHSQQKYGQAMNMLDQAFRLSPGNLNLAMNIMKVSMSICEISQLSNNQKRSTNKAIMLLKKSKLDAEQEKSFKYFREQIGEINQLDLLSTELT